MANKEESSTSTETGDHSKPSGTPLKEAPIRVKSGSMIHYLQIIKSGKSLTSEDRILIAKQARDLIWGQIKAIRKNKYMSKNNGTTQLHFGTNMTLFYNGFVFEGYVSSAHC